MCIDNKNAANLHSIDNFLRQIHVNRKKSAGIFLSIVCIHFAQISLSRMDVEISGIHPICMEFMFSIYHLFQAIFCFESGKFFSFTSLPFERTPLIILSFVHHFHSIALLLCLARKNKETSRASLG